MKVYILAAKPKQDDASATLARKMFPDQPDLAGYAHDIAVLIAENRTIGGLLLSLALADWNRFQEVDGGIIDIIKAGFANGVTKSALMGDIEKYVLSERDKDEKEVQEAEALEMLRNLPDDLPMH